MQFCLRNRAGWGAAICWFGLLSVACGQISSKQFEAEALPALPIEESYEFANKLTEGVPAPPRNPDARPAGNEIEIGEGWAIEVPADASVPLVTAAEELQRYLQESTKVNVPVRRVTAAGDWKSRKQVIVAAARDKLPGCGDALKGEKDYRILVADSSIAVCGFDEFGAAFGLYNLVMRFRLREAPYLPGNLDTVRQSLCRSRMVLSGLGWMDFPDRYLATLPQYGIDAIFCSEYCNANNAPYRGQWGNDPFRKHPPGTMQDLLRRAEHFGLKVYTPVLFNYTGTPQSADELRKLMRDLLTNFPQIRGYVLLAEGFEYKAWAQPPSTSPKEWVEAVRIATEAALQINPKVEILPWDYSFGFAPEQAHEKAALMAMLPESTIPLLTFENGKGFELDGQKTFLRDYAINQVGPSECTVAQLQVARTRKFPFVFAKADTFASWQFGTFPYLPFPYQWYARYEALQEWKIDGTLETWSYGFKPNWVAEMRAWYAWSDAPALDDLLRQIARRDFNAGNEDAVLAAWKHFSQAIQLYPDTGPNRGSCNALIAPLLFSELKPRVVKVDRSWGNRGSRTVTYWPGKRRFPLFTPDFTNGKNTAADYTSPLTIPVFQKYLLLAADEMERGLQQYRQAALGAPTSKRNTAFREVLLAEQLQRMMRSEHAVIEFEGMRVALGSVSDAEQKRALIDKMVAILTEESQRTQSSWHAARRDSRLGFEWEQDYIYTPELIDEKYKMIDRTLHSEIPEFRSRNGL